MADEPYNFARVLALHDGVYIRLYKGKEFIDARITFGCLSNVVGDGAGVMRTHYQNLAASRASTPEAKAG